MKRLFVFFRHSGAPDPDLERDFRRIYQEPRFRYMQASFALGMVGFGAFLLMDVMNGMTPAVQGIPTIRGALTLIFAAALAATYFNPNFVIRHYTPIINFFSSLGMLGAAMIPIAVHGHRSSADLYWSVNSSLTTAAIVIYGFSRLTSRNTALIVVAGCVVGVSTVFLHPPFDWYSFGRLALHIVVVNIVAFSLRETIERRERQLFLLARENLSKNLYAKDLEVARAQAEEGNAIKLRFLANMSHEFRTPMNGVLQTLELVSRTATRDTAHLIEKARRSGAALVSTLNSILEYTGSTQEHLTPKAVAISLSGAVRDVIERHRKTAADRGLQIVLRLDLARSEDLVLCDRSMLEDALSRLLDNAVKFTKAGSIRVNVELMRREVVSYPAAEVQITITDTGVGIPFECLELVFTPFFQVDSGSTRTVAGTGLGLAIARRLSDAMAGSISLESQAGFGTTARFRFPTEICLHGRRPSRTSRRVPVASIQTEKLQGTVLLVEDNEFNAALVLELLRLMGLTATHAVDGELAHRHVSKQPFDVVLMDCQMPNVDGYEATRRIRTSEREGGSARVPIIALTANALSGDRERCLEAGMDDYLAKPYTADELHAKLAAWLPGALVGEGDATKGLRAGRRLRTDTPAS